MATLKDTYEVSAVIAREMQPLSIMLFGSLAENGTGADIDLLTIDDDTASNSADDFAPRVDSAIKPFFNRFAIDSFVIPVSRFIDFLSERKPFSGRYFRKRQVSLYEGIIWRMDETGRRRRFSRAFGNLTPIPSPIGEGCANSNFP